MIDVYEEIMDPIELKIHNKEYENIDDLIEELSSKFAEHNISYPLTVSVSFYMHELCSAVYGEDFFCESPLTEFPT